MIAEEHGALLTLLQVAWGSDAAAGVGAQTTLHSCAASSSGAGSMAHLHARQGGSAGSPPNATASSSAALPQCLTPDAMASPAAQPASLTQNVCRGRCMSALKHGCPIPRPLNICAHATATSCVKTCVFWAIALAVAGMGGQAVSWATPEMDSVGRATPHTGTPTMLVWLATAHISLAAAHVGTLAQLAITASYMQL